MFKSHFHSYLGYQLVGFGQTQEESLANAHRYLSHIGVPNVEDMPIMTVKVEEKIQLNYRFGYCDYCD